jgi:hypothetical protein
MSGRNDAKRRKPTDEKHPRILHARKLQQCGAGRTHVCLDSDCYHKFVVFELEGVVVDRFANNPFLVRIQESGLGLNELTLLSQDCSDRFLNTSELKGTHGRTGK